MEVGFAAMTLRKARDARRGVIGFITVCSGCIVVEERAKWKTNESPCDDGIWAELELSRKSAHGPCALSLPTARRKVWALAKRPNYSDNY